MCERVPYIPLFYQESVDRWRLNDSWSSNFWGGVDKVSIYGMECQLLICREHIRVSKGTLKFFVIDSSMLKLISDSSFEVQLKM